MRYVRLVFLSALHAAAVYLLTLVWMNLSWEFGDEVIVAQANEIARFYIVNRSDARADKFRKDLLFINCSYDKTLVDYEDDHGAGRRQITDRKKLAKMLNTINGSAVPPRLVVVDLLFDDESADDSVLHHELANTRHLILSAEQGDDGSFTPRWPELRHAIAQYSTTTNDFLKYNLVDDTIPFLPAAMYEETTGADFRSSAGLVRTHEGWWMNSFIVDLPVRQSQLDAGEVLVWNLGQALDLYETTEIQEVSSDKIVIVGDIYDYDVHNTLLGSMPGPVIVANAYLGMLKGAPKIRFVDGLLIFLLYLVTTLYIIVWRPHSERLVNSPLYKRKLGKFLFKYFTYLVLFSLSSIFLYIISGRHFQLLLFGIYFNLFEFVVEWYRKRNQPKMEVAGMEEKS